MILFTDETKAFNKEKYIYTLLGLLVLDETGLILKTKLMSLRHPLEIVVESNISTTSNMITRQTFRYLFRNIEFYWDSYEFSIFQFWIDPIIFCLLSSYRKICQLKMSHTIRSMKSFLMLLTLQEIREEEESNIVVFLKRNYFRYKFT